MEHSTAALRLGMIDRIGTLDQTLKRLGGAPARSAIGDSPTRALGADFRARRHAHRMRELAATEDVPLNLDARVQRHRLRFL